MFNKKKKMSELIWKGPLEVRNNSYDPLWTAETEHWYAEIHYEPWFGYSYKIMLNVERTKQITDSFALRENNRHILNDLAKTKKAIESIFSLLDRANKGEIWVGRCVMLGAISETDFQYYAVEGQPK